jgi:DNA-binding beta-propeller fold protein YncE
MSEFVGRPEVRFAVFLAAFASICGHVSAATILYATATVDATHPNGRIFELDYTAGTILNTFNGPAGVLIGDDFTGAAFRQATGELYITDGAGSNDIFRINPATGAVNGFLDSPTGSSSLDGLEFVGDTLYALVLGGGSIAVINPDTGAVIDMRPADFLSIVPGGLTAAGGVLFSRGEANTSIVARNLLTGGTLNSFGAPNNEAVLGLASDGIDLFAASSAGVIYRLNPATGQVLDSRAYGINFDSLAGIVPEPGTASFVSVGLALGCWLRHRKPRNRN